MQSRYQTGRTCTERVVRMRLPIWLHGGMKQKLWALNHTLIYNVSTERLVIGTVAASVNRVNVVFNIKKFIVQWAKRRLLVLLPLFMEKG